MGKFIKFLLVCLGFKSLTACEVFYVQFTDIDGEAGGGLFEEQTVTVQAEKVEEGEGWSRGKYAVKEDVNVVLERQ